MPSHLHAVRLFACLLSVVLLCSCGQAPLFEQVSENDANEVVSVLGRAGVPARKLQHGPASWEVRVSSADVSLALEILNSAGLPRERYRSIGDVFPSEGLISTPIEEHMRSIYAISQELSQTISDIDGVVAVRVHLNVPRRDPLLRAQPAPSASVFVKYRAEANMEQHALAIRNIVVGAVDGLALQNVTVSMFPWSPDLASPQLVDYTQAYGMAVSPRSVRTLMWMIWTPWILLGIVLAVVLLAAARSLGTEGFQRLTARWRSSRAATLLQRRGAR
mgnify:CR=1 FL=1